MIENNLTDDIIDEIWLNFDNLTELNFNYVSKSAKNTTDLIDYEKTKSKKLNLSF